MSGFGSCKSRRSAAFAASFVAATFCSLLAACGSGEARLEPASGSTRGGDAVSVVGADFRGHGSLVVWFGEVPARMVVIESDRLVTVRSPPVDQPGHVEVQLEFADGAVVPLPSGFQYEPDRGIELE